MKLVDALVIGIYAPIILFAGISCFMLVRNLVYPMARSRDLNNSAWFLALGVTFAMAAHLLENLFYGYARISNVYSDLTTNLAYVGILKVLILISCGCSMAALWLSEDHTIATWKIWATIFGTWFASSALVYLV